MFARVIRTWKRENQALNVLLFPPPFFPVGIRKTRGIVNRSPRPKKMNVVLKPFAGEELE